MLGSDAVSDGPGDAFDPPLFDDMREELEFMLYLAERTIHVQSEMLKRGSEPLPGMTSRVVDAWLKRYAAVDRKLASDTTPNEGAT